MPTTTIPLVTPESRRGLGEILSTTKDSYLSACVAVKVINNATNSASFYIEKRPGLLSAGVVSSGNVGTAIFNSPSRAAQVYAFGGSNSTIFVDSTNAGTVTGVVNFISETVIGGITYFLLAVTGSGWYLAHDATADTSFTGDTHTNTTIDNLAGHSGIYVGQEISGTGIVAGTRIATRTPDTSSPTSITVDTATTATNAGVTITKTPVAKIIDADFPTTAVGGFAELDGYIFRATSTARVYQSDLNSVTSWSASNYITANIQTDTGVDLIKYKNTIAAFGSSSIEFFSNVGNPSGSVLASRKDLFTNIGIYPTGDAKKVFQIQDEVFWIGSDFNIYTLNGFAPSSVSKQAMTIAGTGFAPSYLSAFKIGTDFIISCTTGSVSGASVDKWYSRTNDLWYEPNFGVGSMIFVPIWATATSVVGGGVSANNTDGKVFSLKSTTYQDNGSAFTMTIQTEPKVLNKGRGFKINSIELLADTQSSGSTTLEISRNDYGSFQTLGSFPLTSNRKRITRGGYCRHHAIFRLTDSGNQAWRGQAIVVDWEPCAA